MRMLMRLGLEPPSLKIDFAGKTLYPGLNHLALWK